uniref:Putative secreted protein n=1 Tax=Anopheles marajoara TaxID=58244 RepID=A0A2M4C8N1_9DIPT
MHFRGMCISSCSLLSCCPRVPGGIDVVCVSPFGHLDWTRMRSCSSYDDDAMFINYRSSLIGLGHSRSWRFVYVCMCGGGYTSMEIFGNPELLILPRISLA